MFQHGAVSPVLVNNGCSMDTLRQEGLVDRCFSSDDKSICQFDL